VSIKEFFNLAEKVDRKIKIAILPVSFCASFLIISFFTGIITGKKNSITEENNKIMNLVTGTDERLVAIKIKNSSKFVLDTINSDVRVDVLATGKKGNAVVIATDARPVQVAREKDSEGENYILSLILSRQDALRVFRVQEKFPLSVMIHTHKRYDGMRSRIYAKKTEDINAIEIIEEDGELYE